MKYIFIINPMAGKQDPTKTYGEEIERICKEKGLDYEILKTESVGHATELARNVVDKATEENPVRVFAVGGDGTLCETANGMMNKPYCELGCIPSGSGNDYNKSFAPIPEFQKLEEYITARSVEVDAMSSELMNSINIASLGLDANICDMANQIKTKNKKLSGPKAYNKAVFKCLMGDLYNELKITIDDDKVFEGKYMFSLAASGQYYGSGIRSAPMADPCDGQLDFVFVKTMSHLRALALVSAYKTGEYYYKKKYKKIITHVRGSKIRIESKKDSVVNIDGECFHINDVTINIMPKALRFIVPNAYFELKEKAAKEAEAKKK